MRLAILNLMYKAALLVQGDRYDCQRAVIGSSLQDKIQQMQVALTCYLECACLHRCRE